MKKRTNDIAITFLYGKCSNKQDYKLCDEDLEFLKSFPNIRIIYNARLYAKFYSNEQVALVTSLNLNHFSPNNNIEYGIKLEGEEHPLAVQIKAFMKIVAEEGSVVFDSKE